MKNNIRKILGLKAPFSLYDVEGNIIYIEHVDGYWEKLEYYKKDYLSYRENSFGRTESFIEEDM